MYLLSGQSRFVHVLILRFIIILDLEQFEITRLYIEINWFLLFIKWTQISSSGKNQKSGTLYNRVWALGQQRYKLSKVIQVIVKPNGGCQLPIAIYPRGLYLKETYPQVSLIIKNTVYSFMFWLSQEFVYTAIFEI